MRCIFYDVYHQEAKNNDKNTALNRTSENGYPDVRKYFISVGAIKESKNNFGDTPLVWASKYGHLDISKYFISVGVNKKAKNFVGYTPFDVVKSHVKDYRLSAQFH